VNVGDGAGGELGNEQRRFWQTGLLLFVWILWFAVMIAAGQLLSGWKRGVAVSYLVSGLLELLLLVPAVVFMRLGKIRLSILFGKPHAAQIASGALLGALMVPALLPVSALWALLIRLTGGALPVVSRFPAPVTLWQAVAAFVTMGLAAPLVEEPVMRGLLLNASGGMLGRNKAILLVSILFALLHGQFAALPSIFLAGVLLAVLAWHSGTLWPSMAAHGAFNITSVLLSAVVYQLQKSASAGSLAGGVSPDSITNGQLFSAACAYLVIALPFVIGGAAVLWAYLRYTPVSSRPVPVNLPAVTFGRSWPWAASLILLIAYITLDVLAVYGIIGRGLR
jgi:membrane protease YdiL (CAAX protease family)